MTLFHSSSFIVQQPDVCHSRPNLDFGRGFYLTMVREQAARYAERFVLRGKPAYVNEYLLDDNLAGFDIKRFDAYDEEWLEYVSACRRGVEPPHRYDVVEGGVANDKVFNTVDLYFAGVITKQAALGRLRFESPNHQICILNQEILDCHLHFIKADKL